MRVCRCWQVRKCSAWQVWECSKRDTLCRAVLGFTPSAKLFIRVHARRKCCLQAQEPNNRSQPAALTAKAVEHRLASHRLHLILQPGVAEQGVGGSTAAHAAPESPASAQHQA